MVKKIVNLLLILAFVLSTAACSSQPTTNTGTPTDSINGSNNQQNNVTTDTDSNDVDITETVVASSLEELETIVLKDVEDSIASLATKKNQLASEIDSFEKYVENGDKIKGFYDDICTETLRLEICLMEYSVVYAEFINIADNTVISRSM